jgi:signal transduction histidine kinase
MEPLRVLVADDEPGMRAGVVRTLRGFTVHVPDVNGQVSFTLEQAASGEEALEIIHAGAPDILLLDHKMPGISGLDVLDQVAGLDTDMLTIMITAYASIETAVTATKRGAYDFLAKPFTPDELKATVRKAAARLILAKQARQLAAEKRQVRFQFIRVLGHELKAPLAAIEGYLDILKQRTLGDSLQGYGEVVDRSLLRVEGMRKLIADLLDVTQIESGLKNRQLVPLDVAAIARSCIETLQAEAAARRIGIELHADGPMPMTADRGEIEMLLTNLLSNAVKYNRDGGRVDLTLSRDAGRLTIRVADTGIGMTPEEIALLFGEFSRIRNAKTAHILGSGLGLSIVKKLAALYGGEPTVQSVPDVGTTFQVVLNDS